MKRIEIIPIAWKKLARRGIPEEWVRETINYPGQIVDGYGGRVERYWRGEKDED